MTQHGMSIQERRGVGPHLELGEPGHLAQKEAEVEDSGRWAPGVQHSDKDEV